MLTPGRTLLAGCAVLGLWAGQQGPAFREDTSAFRTALSRQQASADEAGEAFNRLGAVVTSLVYRLEPEEDEPAPPESGLPQVAAEVAHRPPRAPHRPVQRFPSHSAPFGRPPPGAVVLLGWDVESTAFIAPAAGSAALLARPPFTRPVRARRSASAAHAPSPPAPRSSENAASAAYAALEAGALEKAAALFREALAAMPNSQLAADLAYTNLRLARRGEAIAAFETALRLGPTTPEAGRLWRQEVSRLTDRFSLQAYALLRQDKHQAEAAPLGVAAPGQSQSALILHYRPDPTAQRPIALIGRLFAAHHGEGSSPFLDTAQGTAGLGWTFAPAAQGTLVAERWVKLGEDSRGAWALRAYGGYGEGYGPDADSTYWLHWSAFGEAAVVGLHRRDLFAGGEARAGYGRAVAPQTRATITAALWASVQHDDRTRHRVEAGPSLGLETSFGRTAVHLRLDYRIALAAKPTSGNSLALTLAAGF